MTISAQAPTYSPDRFNFTKDVVDHWAHAGGNPLAMVWNPPDSNPKDIRTFHFSHFSERARQVAVGLRDLGIKKGDVLLLVSSKTPDWYEVLCGAILGGLAVCLCSSALVPSEIQSRAQKARAKAFVADADQVNKFLALPKDSKYSNRCSIHIQIGAPAETSYDSVTPYSALIENSEAHDEGTFHTDPNDACLLYFTSGTTGNAKMVKHTHVSYPYGHIITGEHWLDLCPGQMLWNLSDQGWAKAMWAFFGAWSQGAAFFIDADTSPFDPERTVDILHNHPITTFCAAPTIYRQLITGSKQAFAAKPPQALEHCTSAGESLGSHVIMEWRDMTDGLMIYDGFGQTETSILCGNYSSISPRQGSMGKPLPGVPLYVLNDERQVAHPFEEGDMAVKVNGSDSDSSNFRGIFEGYVYEDGLVARPVVTDKEGQAWYLTGDRAHCDEDGYFWYKGRGDDVIISAGHRIGPAEVESVLLAHPAVRESAVVAAPEERRGAIVKAFIVLHDGQDASSPRLMQDIREHCLQHKAAHYCPQKIEFVSSSFLPKTVSGKVIRKQLRMLEMPEGS